MVSPTSPRTRLAELTGALALATDAGAALAPETSLRTCAIALGIARTHGTADIESHDVFCAALLRHVGCTSVAHEESRVAGDELELSRAMRPLDRWPPAATIPALVRGVAVGRGPLRRALAVTRVIARAPSVAPVTFRGRCEVAVRMASRLALGPGVERAQFADLDHHIRTSVHPKLSFRKLEPVGGRTRFEQKVRLLGITQRDVFEREWLADATLRDTSIEGFNQGGSLHFGFTPAAVDGREGTEVAIRIRLPLPAPLAWLAPLLRAQVRREVTAAANEDKADLEQRGYVPAAH